MLLLKEKFVGGWVSFSRIRLPEINERERERATTATANNNEDTTTAEQICCLSRPTIPTRAFAREGESEKKRETWDVARPHAET